MVVFNKECEWAWSKWEELLIEVVLEHANIKAEKIYAEDMDNEEITVRVKEMNVESGECMENTYIIRYFEDTAIRECFMFAYFFYLLEEYDMTLLDNGAYQIRWENGEYKHLRLED